MRKKDFPFRKILWYSIIGLPLVSFVVYLIANHDPMTFAEFLGSVFGIASNNVIVQTLNAIFAQGDVLGFVGTNSGAILYLAWFVLIELFHILMDVLMLLPNLCHFCLDKLNPSERGDF